MEIKRAYLDNCTIGKLYFKGEFVCYTMERPWQNNKPSISCVPAGTYNLDPYESNRFKDCFSLTCHDLGVGLTRDYHRNYILIHPGNFPLEVQGCIAPGMQLRSTTWGVSESRIAMDEIRAIIKNNNVKYIRIS